MRKAKKPGDALRQRYEMVMGAINESVYEWDLARERFWTSESMQRLLGLSPGRLTLDRWRKSIHPDDYARFRDATVAHLKGETERFECDYRFRSGDGTWHWARTHGLAVRDRAGRALRMVGSTGDITELKRAELETREGLEQQEAIAEVLGVVTQLQTDVQPVFQAIGRNAARLCGALFSCVYRFDGELIHLVATHNLPFAAMEVGRTLYPMRPDRSQLSGRAVLTRSVQRLEDATQDPEYARHVAVAGGWRRLLAVPMLREGEPLGVIAVGWRDPGPIPEPRVELLKTFAHQAVIAIEKARLFNDTKEALEQQTATAEILEITARSPSDVQPVFDAIARNALRLCQGAHCAVFRFDGRLQHFAAQFGVDAETVELLRRIYPRPPDPARVSGRAILEREAIHLADALADGRFPGSVETLTSAGNRAVLAVPMLKGGEPIGVLFMVRRESRRFSERQVALLKTFADQAVIAIENVRLFNETREALEQQKALAEVLGTISSSIADTQPVLDLILDSCQRLFEGHLVGLTLAGEDGRVRLGAYKGDNPEAMAAVYPYPLGRDSGSGQAILDRKVVHFPDVDAPGSDAPPRVLAGSQAAGFKAIVFAPLLDEGHGIGALWVGRRLPGPFSERQTALLKSFADQAVIAIRNARLFSEIREKGRQLEAANRHKSQFLANMSHELRTPLNAIIGFARIVARHSQGRLEPKQLDNLEKLQAAGQHLLALINAILDLSKVEAGRVEVRPGEVALAPVLEECLRTVEPLVRVALVREFDGGLPAMYVDEEKLRQIVLNLLSNAAKFTERGTIRLRAQAANGSVAIAVADTGIGIPGDKLGLIFEEFEQLDAAINRAHGGTGLGLAIAQRLARLMGGDIGVESALGGGSTFTLTLPVRYAA